MKRLIMLVLVMLAILSGCTTPTNQVKSLHKPASALTIGQSLNLEYVDANITHEVKYLALNGNFCQFEVDGKTVQLLIGTAQSYPDGKGEYFDVLCNASENAKGVEVQFSDQWIASITDR